ncbi:MAG: hypothetical protein EAX90_13690 [Candidatus Heimdallarchaeota archaeon]|nr:hypothetical protein [Candidatus Heimdallarchaeota archaeon]
MAKRSRAIESEILVKLIFENPKIAKTILLATAPENREAPKGIIALSEQKGNSIEFSVKSEESFWDLIVTLEDFFEKVDISNKTIKGIKK